MRICPNCDQLMVLNVKHNSLLFQCHSCGTEVSGNANDTLIFMESKSTSIESLNHELKYMTYDKAIKKVRFKPSCPNCNYKYARQISVGQNLVPITKCIKCEKQFDNVEFEDDLGE